MPTDNWLCSNLPLLQIRNRAREDFSGKVPCLYRAAVIALLAVIYVFVLVGSALGICALLGVRVLLRNRSVRKFVRSIRHRVHLAEERNGVHVRETAVQRSPKNFRTSAIALQETRSFVRKAEKSYAQGRVEEAERFFIQALTSSPDSCDVRAQLAKFYLQTGREQKAEALYKELLTEHEDVSYFANLGLAYYRQGKYEESCVSYHEAYQRDAQSPERSAALGRACVAAKHFGDAADFLERACERLSRDTQLLHLLAECYLQIGKTEEAHTAYKRINKLEPYDEAVKEKLVVLAKA
ncbi:hypothetical protein COU76_04945 [Candidatus Peregrinibacteria bacterium CG10_big_fil_rev_8_21_14_0_10_49_10]|nr:MAG: hypothetical protein COU76_04945 [Candidatus Peregrinibacteria bacterium CG10_big_fil_rev_8_21_14_0_10_49_10]